MLWLYAGSQKSLTFVYTCTMFVFLVQNEGFLVGSASNRTTVKSLASTLGRRRSRRPAFVPVQLEMIIVFGERRAPLSPRGQFFLFRCHRFFNTLSMISLEPVAD
jgi:hypothetical protein